MVAQLSWESICLTSRGSQVRALLRPPCFLRPGSSVGQNASLSRQRSTVRARSRSPFFYKFVVGFIAQLVEQGTENPRVSGSIPLEATNSFMVDVAQLVRAPVCGTGGREFESHLPPHYFPPENNIGLQPSGKAPDFDSGMRQFESSQSSQDTRL